MLVLVNRAYQPRIVDDQLDRLLGGLPAVCLDGPRAVGKTATALRWARTVHDLDDPETEPVDSGLFPATASASSTTSWSFTSCIIAIHDGAGSGMAGRASLA